MATYKKTDTPQIKQKKTRIATRGNVPLRTFTKWAILSIFIIGSFGFFAAHFIVQQKEQDAVYDIQTQLSIKASANADLIKQWLLGKVDLLDQITKSDLVRLFAAEIQLTDISSKSEIRDALTAQKPYMERTLQEFAERHRLTSVHLVGNDGKVYLSNQAVPVLTVDQNAAIKDVLATAKAKILKIRTQDDGSLAIDILKPIIELQDEDMAPKVVSTFMVTIPVKAAFTHLLALGSLAKKGERLYLLQPENDHTMLIRPEKVVALGVSEETLMSVKKGSAQSVVDNQKVFAQIVPVKNTPFYVLREFESSQALAPAVLYKQGIYGLMSLLVMALIALTLMMLGHLLAQRNRARVRMLGQTMKVLIRAVEIRDPYLAGHHERVARLAVKMGNKLGLATEDRSTLFYGAQLSGIGKIFVPQEILTKKGKLTKAERAKLEKHVVHAESVLSDVDLDVPVADVISQMHERLDGSGYPLKLKGQDVQFLSRVLGVCDVYCALTQPRSYRKEMLAPEALDLMVKEGKKFDIRVIDALKDIIK